MHTPEQRAEIRRRFAAVDTSNVADVLDGFGRPDQGLAPSLAAVSGERVAGWAYTIRGQMRPYSGGGDAAKMEACQGIGPDEVAVWAGDGHGVCYFGELIALGLRERGCVGALVDGGVRDLRWLRRHDFPVFARYRTPVQSIGRWAVTGWQEPVYLRGATTAWVSVEPGDFVLADEDGAIVVPSSLVSQVLEAAERLTATEVSIRAALQEGLTLVEALARFGHV
ncbi:RraA family protein [Jiangella mangrovi]|uniref:Putative 4-hydroxy-4-methyl-2-oxoglutarate aldolase n=1 Tax=Jiangella mangrovi TaxID=1524084 RepID=A0A7W9LQ68_9ACTN|nr:regulator of RNase E activity RraA [Jiangella mangrovi]